MDILASDISADSSASAAAASNQFGISKSNNENIYQAQLIQTLRVLVRQSSKDILKVFYYFIFDFCLFIFYVCFL